MELDLHFMIIYLCIKFQSNTPILSKDIALKPKVLGTGRMDRTDVHTDSGDTICPPTENGGGIKISEVILNFEYSFFVPYLSKYMYLDSVTLYLI